MNPTVYIETTVISYLTSRPSRDLIVAAHQQITMEWWEKRRKDFDVYSSLIAVRESSKGDSIASQKRLSVLSEIPLLEIRDETRLLVNELLKHKVLPQKASEDAFHIAVAATNRMEYLLTWNCKHIANAQMKFFIENVCQATGYQCPIICTPEELLGEFYVE